MNTETAEHYRQLIETGLAAGKTLAKISRESNIRYRLLWEAKWLLGLETPVTRRPRKIPKPCEPFDPGKVQGMESRILAGYEEGLVGISLSCSLGITRKALASYERVLGLRPPASSLVESRAKANRSRIEALLKKGDKSMEQMAVELGLGAPTLYRYVRSLGLKAPRRKRSQLSRQRGAAIVAMRRQGFTLREIGEKYNVTRERIRQILRICEKVDVLATEKVFMRCPVCRGPIFSTDPRKVWCSTACQTVYRNSAKKMHRETAEKVLDYRLRQKLSWKEIDEKLGCHFIVSRMQANYRLFTLAELVELNFFKKQIKDEGMDMEQLGEFLAERAQARRARAMAKRARQQKTSTQKRLISKPEGETEVEG